METKEYYSVLVPVINLILTGYNEIDENNGIITLSTGYQNSTEEYSKGKQSLHFLDSINRYLESLSLDQKKDIVKIILDNDVLLTATILTHQLESSTPINISNDNQEYLDKVVFNYLSDNTVDPFLYKILYMYLENLHRIERNQWSITITEYNRILKLNKKERDRDDILNMFT